MDIKPTSTMYSDKELLSLVKKGTLVEKMPESSNFLVDAGTPERLKNIKKA